MLGSHSKQLSDELRRNASQLDHACRRRWGITATMFRTFKFLFYMSTLLFTGYLVEYAGVEPFTAMVFAALLITGPEGAEAFLVRVGELEDSRSGSGGDGGGGDD